MTFKGAVSRKITALDEHGHPSRSIEPRKASGRIDLPKTTLYPLIER